MIDKDYGYDVYKEALTFIAYFDKELLERLPQDMFEKLTNLAAESNTEFYVDVTKTLAEQKISEECKDLISLIYYNCIADETEKNEILRMWNINDKRS